MRFAKDLSAAGLTGIVAYSRSGAKAQPGDALHAEAAAAGVTLVKTMRALCKSTDVIIALTPGKAALAAAKKISKHLQPGQIYVDMSSAAVKTMEDIAQLLDGKARFVDAAIMSPVPLNGIKGVIGASGADAEAFRVLMEPYGMNVKVVGVKPGGASAMKLIRSVCMKGLSAVLLECLEVAHRYGVLEAAAADIAGSFDERPFAQNMKRYVCGTAVHAERRIHEMADVLALLNSLDSSTRMTKSTRAKLMDVSKMGLREKFNAREPDTIAAVMDAIVALGPSKA
ncbi:MAG: 3-hydroxyisobutyrate dehydrogenase [Betaproteobacteria bacterium]|nr:3-hydroxyisobutyrate dehydrogenase [Betaproteobacteria bacterium]